MTIIGSLSVDWHPYDAKHAGKLGITSGWVGLLEDVLGNCWENCWETVGKLLGNYWETFSQHCIQLEDDFPNS